MKYYDYTGVIHFHSVFSFDGYVGLAKIIDAAAKNNIDFLMLTDHDHLKARDEGWEGWQGKVLLIVGQEISPRFNHYLGFNLSKAVISKEDALGIPPQQYIDEVNNAGGFGFIAHPDHEGTKTFHVKHYPWTDWSVDGYAGISIWDFMTDWQSSLKRYLPSFLSFFFPAFFLRGPRRITLERWDSLNQTKKIVGIGELDNHGSIKRIAGIKIAAFSFNRAFKFIRTHICTQEPLSGNSQKDISLLFNSLRSGSCYVAMEYFQSSQGFSFCIIQNNKEYTMGDSVILADKAQIYISLPALALVRIISNGMLLHEITSKEILQPVKEKGIYRVEAYLKRYGKYRPWIFSNPIFVK
ncbi:MAG: PHP domain-containing protein [Smithellaceae bacterium]